jgi:hypothetical protein
MYPIRRRRPREPAGSPNTCTVPDRIFWTPTMQRISVVLPLPLGPSRPVTAPLAMVQLNPCSTWLVPRWTTRSRTSTACSMLASWAFNAC